MRILRVALGLSCLWFWQAQGQIDPFDRELVQLGYNAAMQGHAPLSAYAFYYHNMPGFLRTNLTLRLAVAPTYVDSELGIAGLLGEHTDAGVGLAGGGFGDNYNEIREGKYRPRESFYGHSGELNASVYHLFNPGAQIPLNAILRIGGHFSFFGESEDTDDDFELPNDRGIFRTRVGLRWGGREPTLYPGLAMAVSVWYDGSFRMGSDVYGFDDRELNDQSHQFWVQGTIAYTFPNRHNMDIGLTAGTTIEADRFSAFRLGALLPLISEFPLSLPGYYYQEISAESFVLFSGSYLLPLESTRRWNIVATAATAAVDYLNGLEQSGNWHTGAGAGILYRTASVKTMIGYAYGVDAIRSDGRGAHSIGILMQLDWGRAKRELFDPASPNLWQGFQRVFGLFGN